MKLSFFESFLLIGVYDNWSKERPLSLLLLNVIGLFDLIMCLIEVGEFVVYLGEEVDLRKLLLLFVVVCGTKDIFLLFFEALLVVVKRSLWFWILL